MATLKTLQVLGEAQGSQPASQPGDFVRFQEFSGTLSGKANVVHTHNVADVSGLIPFLMTALAQNLQDTFSIDWQISGSYVTGANVSLQLNGGLLVGAEGLSVDSGTVSLVGHHHVTSDINDFANALYQTLTGLYAASNTIAFSFVGNEISGTVIVQPASGLLSLPDGLACDFGSGTDQVARGDHTHSQLHNPLTVVEGNSIDLELVGQQLTAEVILAPLSGLLILPSGLAVDFGSGTNQAARGDHTHALLHEPITTVSDNSLVLAVSNEQVLSGTVIVDLDPPGGFGLIEKGVNGLSVVLGSGTNESAAGNHGHSVATESANGFMSLTDKQHLDVLWADSGTGAALPQSGTMDSLNVRVLYLVNVNTGQSKAIWLDDLGVIHLGSGTVIG